jgi:hypothetical protein
MNEHQFKTDKDTLAKQIDLLLKKGKSIYEEKLKLDSSWQNSAVKRVFSFNYLRNQAKLSREENEFEVNCILIEKDFQRLNMIAQYKEKVEPLKYSCFFILGIFGPLTFFI